VSIDGYGNESKWGSRTTPIYSIISHYLCDFDKDMDVDFADYTLYLSYLNYDGFDSIGDVAQSGAIFDKPPPWPLIQNPMGFDGIIGYDDHMVFTHMYNWFNELPSILYPDSINYKTKFWITPRNEYLNEKVSIKLNFSGAVGAIGAHIEMASPNNEIALLKDGFSQAQRNTKIDQFSQNENHYIINNVIFGESITLDTLIYNLEFIPYDTGKLTIQFPILRIDYSNGSVWTIIDTSIALRIESQLPRVYKLGHSYPNPFNSKINIPLEIPGKSFVTLTIYDISGRQVEVIYSGDIQPGYYQFQWDSVLNSSGVYFVQLKSEDKVITKKIIDD